MRAPDKSNATDNEINFPLPKQDANEDSAQDSRIQLKLGKFHTILKKLYLKYEKIAKKAGPGPLETINIYFFFLQPASLDEK